MHARIWPNMDGQKVFKTAVKRMPEVIQEVLAEQSLKVSDIDMLIPHQTEHLATWTLEIRTRNGDVSMTVYEKQGQKLSPGTYVRVNYRIGRLSHSPVAVTFTDSSVVTVEEQD